MEPQNPSDQEKEREERDRLGLCMTKAQLQALPIEEQRVEIAKDVLRMMRSRRFVARRGTYMELEFSIARAVARDPRVRLDKLFRDKSADQAMGSVCAIGAVFCAALDKFGRLKGSDIQLGGFEHDGVKPEKMLEYLSPWFSAPQLRLMELAFEHEWHGGNRMPSDEDYYNAKDFASDGENAESAMEMIMKNVIENKGTFTP
jgi:hypothetical protein